MSVFFDPFRSLISEPFGQQFGSGLSAGGDAGLYPNTENLLAWYRTDIVDGKLKSYLPPSSHTTQQVKSSGFLGAGNSPCPGLEITDTITASGAAPTCSVAGTLTFTGPDCWDIWVHRAGVLWASWKGINAGKDAEIDASGNGHHLIGLVGTTITERLDGSGTNYANEVGFTVSDGVSMWLDEAQETLVETSWRIPALLGDPSVSCSWSVEYNPLTVDEVQLYIDDETLNIGA